MVVLIFCFLFYNISSLISPKINFSPYLNSQIIQASYNDSYYVFKLCDSKIEGNEISFLTITSPPQKFEGIVGNQLLFLTVMDISTKISFRFRTFIKIANILYKGAVFTAKIINTKKLMLIFDAGFLN